MAVNKNFVIKNGIEVDGFLIYGDANTNQVGINTDIPDYTLDVIGGIGASTLTIRDDFVLGGTLSVGSSTGKEGQYLISTGTGVTWSQSPSLRESESFVATIGQSTFNFSYNPSVGVDVFINGVRLSPSEYSALDGLTIVLNDACFGGESVDLIAYSVFSLGTGVTGITGLTVLDEGTIIGNVGNIVSLDFVGSAVTSVSSGFGATITVNESWTRNSTGISTLSNVSIGTDNATSTLTVDGNATFSGIVTATNGFISVGNTTPIQISLSGNLLTFTAPGIGSTTFTLF
jgi:hypothetical protein